MADPFTINFEVDAVAVMFPRMTDYFGAWAMEQRHLENIVAHVGQMDVLSHVRNGVQARVSSDSMGGNSSYQVTADGVAVIDLSGTLMKQVSSMDGGTSTVDARRQIRNAASSDRVKAIMLRVDSPGGTVSGTHDLAAEIAAAGEKKPVIGYAEDLCASAAYWAISQCMKVFANPTAMIGSIGTYAVIQDVSAMAGMKGVKVHVVKAGDMKGMGVPGTQVSDAQLEEMQRLVDGSNQHFLAGVAAGRKMSMKRVSELADGRVHLAADAMAMGLIDGVKSFDDALAAAGKMSARQSMKAETEINLESSELENQAGETPSAEQEKVEENPMAEEQSKETKVTVPVAASLAQLKAALPGAGADFMLAQLEAGATIADAQAAFILKQHTELEEAKAKIAAAPKEPIARTGNQPLGSGKPGKEFSDPQAEWEQKIKERHQEKLKTGMRHNLALNAARSEINRENPGLREAFKDSFNAQNHNALVSASNSTAEFVEVAV